MDGVGKDIRTRQKVFQGGVRGCGTRT